MFYAVKDGPRGPQLRSVRFASDLGNDEVLYEGPIKMKSDGLTIDMAFDKRCGLRPKDETELLDDLKKETIQQVKQSCERTLGDGVMTSLGFKMDCDDRSVSMLTATATMLQQLRPEKVAVCDYDNQTHEVSLDEFQKLALEVGAYVSSVYQQKWMNRRKISEATSSTALEALKVS